LKEKKQAKTPARGCSRIHRNRTQREPVTSFSETPVGIGEQIGVLESNRAQVEKILARKDVHEALQRSGLGGSNFLWDTRPKVANSSVYRMLYYVKSSPEMRGDAIKDARGSLDRAVFSAGAAIRRTRNEQQGRRALCARHGRQRGKYLAIVLDSTVVLGTGDPVEDTVPGGLRSKAASPWKKRKTLQLCCAPAHCPRL